MNDDVHSLGLRTSGEFLVSMAGLRGWRKLKRLRRLSGATEAEAIGSGN